MAATMSAQPKVDAATATYHQEAAVEEQQEAETVKPNTMAARLFKAVELIGLMEVKQQVVTSAARDYKTMDKNRPHVDQISKEARQERELLGGERKSYQPK